MFELKVSHREEALQRLKVQQKDFVEEVRSCNFSIFMRIKIVSLFSVALFNFATNHLRVSDSLPRLRVV